MGVYYKILLVAAAILLIHFAKSDYVDESLINEPLYAKQSAEELSLNNFATEQDSGYDDDDYDLSELDNAAVMDYLQNSQTLADEEDYRLENYDDGDDEHKADVADYESERDNKYEVAVEQEISGVKVLKDALEYGISELKKLGNNAICSTIEGRCNTLQTEEKGTCSTSGSVTEFRAGGNQKVPLASLLKFSAPFSLYLVYASYDCASYDINVTVSSDVVLNIIPNFMEISGLSASVAAQVTSPSNTLTLDVGGSWKIGSLVIAITASYDITTGTTVINAHPRSGTSLASFIKSITGLSLPVSPSTTVSFQFNGELQSGGATTMTLVSDTGSVKFFAVYQSLQSGSPAAKAIAVEVPKLRFRSVIKQYVGIDISSIPFFGTFTVPQMGVAYSTGEVENLGDLFQNTQLLKELNGQIASGFSALIQVPFNSDPLLVTYREKMLVITTPKRNLKLTNILKYLASGGGNWKISLPSQLKSIFDLNIDEVAIKGGVTTITVKLPNPIVFFSGILSVSDVEAAIVIQNKVPKVSAAVSGNIQLADGTFATRLAQNSDLKYVLSAVGNKLTINTLFSKLGAEVLPTALTSFLHDIPFLTFSIKNPSVSYTFGVTPMQMHIGGTPVVQGYTVVHMDTVVARVGDSVKIIMGFKLGTTNFASLLKEITKFDFARFPLLSQPITASVTVSPLTTDSIYFSGDLKSLSIEQGVTLRASMKFPKSCTDIFCKYAGILIGHNTVLSLQATISSATNFPIQASINNLRLGAGLILGKAGIEIVGGASARIGLVGEVILKNPALTFAARISAGTKGLTCELSMTGCWNKPFGVDWLDICDLLGSVDFAPPTGITGISYGAEIHLGYKSSGHQIQAKGYVGVSIINPIENYYYVKFNSITIGSLLKAFKLSVSVPKPLAVSGFPNGFLSSFSALGKELPQVHVSIPAGFRLKGTLNILGLQGSADITLNIPSLVDINVALPPIKVGSLLEMYKSSSDTNNGPYLKAKVQVLPSIQVNIQASGYLKVLGISIETQLTVTNTQFIYSFRGRMLNLFYASLRIVASYGSISRASFIVSGTFETDLIHGIQDLVKKAVNSIGNTAKKGYDAAYNTAKAAVDKLQSAVNSAQNAVNSLTDKVRSLFRKRLIAKIMASCPNHACHKVAIQGFGSFFRSVTRAVTRAGNTVKKGAESVSSLAKEALNKAKSELNDAKNKLTSLTNELNKAKDTLANVGNKFKDGLKIFNYISEHGLGAIISISKISFSVGLGVATSGHFSCGVDVRFLGAGTQHFGLSINLHSLSGVADDLKDKVLSAFKSLG